MSYPTQEAQRRRETGVGSPIGTGLCYMSQQTYIEVNDTYSEGGTHEETLCPQSKARVMNKRQRD